jgi:tetraacyldisaccharide 4'-kinase
VSALRTIVERRLQEIWYGPRSPGVLLRAVAKVFGLVTKLRRKCYAFGWLRQTKLPVPVVVVGNLVAGGTGKTPTTIALIKALRRCGYVPGAVSRGYGRHDTKLRMVTEKSMAEDVGDEPLLIAISTGAPVAVHANRVKAGRALLAMHPDVNIIIADDGLQHLALSRDVEILLIDGEREFGNGLLMPAGPMRETMKPLERFPIRIATRKPSNLANFFLPFRTADCVWNLHDQSIVQPLSAWKNQDIAAIAGIANPQMFFDQLASHGLRVCARAYPDHRNFESSDLDFAGQRDIFCTAKDAVKLRALNNAKRIWVVPLDVELDANLLSTLLELVRGKDAAA